MSVPGDGSHTPSPAVADQTGVAVLAVVGLVLASVAGVALLAGPAAAGDRVALFEFPEPSQTAGAGETVEIAVWLRSDGGYAGEGLESYEFVVAVPPEVGEPVDAEPGPFLAGNGAEVEQTTSDAGPGALRIRHERVGVENGTTGWARAATVTVDVRADAPAADATVLVADPDSTLADSYTPMRSFGANATLVVAGGGERLQPAYDPGENGAGVDAGGVNVTTAADVNRSVRTGGTQSDAVSGGDAGSALTGFGVAVGLFALVVAAAIRRR